MKYKVAFYYDIGGTVEVEAETETEAKNKVYKVLEDKGASGIVDDPEFKIENREYATLDTQVVE